MTASRGGLNSVAHERKGRNMPKERVSGTDLTYYLIGFDKVGNERREPSGGLLSERVENDLPGAVTDIFIFSHGWKGDIPAAREQYGRWVKVMAEREAGIAQVKETR